MHNISGATGKHSLRLFVVGGFSGSECICPSTTIVVCERCMKNDMLIICSQLKQLFELAYICESYVNLICLPYLMK